MADDKFEFKILTKKLEEYIELDDGYKLPLLYPSIGESFNLLDFISSLGDMDIKKLNITQKDIDNMSDEEYTKFIGENSKNLTDMTSTFLPKLISYFKWGVSKKLGRELTDDENETVEILVIQNLDIVISRFLDFINKVMPENKKRDVRKNLNPSEFKTE